MPFLLKKMTDLETKFNRVGTIFVCRIDEVVWDGETIVVLGEVRVTPPYKAENVIGEKDASVTLVKKIVDKYWKETPVP